MISNILSLVFSQKPRYTRNKKMKKSKRKRLSFRDSMEKGHNGMSHPQQQTPSPFSETALVEAATLDKRVSSAVLERVEVQGVTIAGPLSNMCDTALWLERTPHGGYTLLVSIVDVGSFVTAHITPSLDDEAYTRGFTHFTAEKVFVPLLPESLAEGGLSLLEGQPCPTLTLSMPFDASFHPSKPDLQKTFVRSRKRFTYRDVDDEMADGRAEFSSLFREAFFLALEVWNARAAHGSLVSYDLETGWVTTEDGVRILLEEDKRFVSYLIMQEFTILANKTLASYLAEQKQPALYRNHVVQVPQAKATYSPNISGHGGLQVPVYLHASHPLHSYPDLVNQRVLLASLREEPSPYTTTELEALSLSLNAQEAIIKAAKPKHFLREYHEHLQKRIEEEPIESLDPKQFHSAIRRAAEEHALTPLIEQEIYRRLELTLLKDNDLYALVFRYHNSGEQWERVHRAVCSFLQHHPEQAAMLYNRGQQEGRWAIIRFDTTQTLRRHFQARLTLACEGQEYSSSVHTAVRKERAKHLALVDVFASLVGVVLPPLASHALS